MMIRHHPPPPPPPPHHPLHQKTHRWIFLRFTLVIQMMTIAVAHHHHLPPLLPPPLLLILLLLNCVDCSSTRRELRMRWRSRRRPRKTGSLRSPSARRTACGKQR